MTIRATKFTPEVLLSAPRRSAGIPSADGKLVLYSQSSYSFESHSKTSGIYVLDVANGQSTLLTHDAQANEAKWLGDGTEIAWLKEGENGNTSFVISDASEPGKSYTAGTVAGPISNLKLRVLGDGMIAIAVSGQANPDGSLRNPKDVRKSHSSGRYYTSTFVRHWDHWVDDQRNAIWTALLQKSTPHVTGKKGIYSLTSFQNVLKGSKLECPIPPFGGTDHFDICSTGIIFVAKDPDLDPATHTRCNTYMIPKADYMNIDTAEPLKIEVPGLQGAASSPVFAPDGQSATFLKMKHDGYEADRNRIILVHFNYNRNGGICDQFQTETVAESWDRSPSSLWWSAKGDSMFIQAEDEGCGCLFQLLLTAGPNALQKEAGPRKLTTSGYISEVVPIAGGGSRLFISSTTLVDNSLYTILDPSSLSSPPLKVSSATHDGSLFGLSPSQVSSLWWDGAQSHRVHAWMMKPSFFKRGHKYPLAYLIHGGPQGAWGDQWSTRWNPAVFAEQGYVVVCPNPTGSTGYGQVFTDAIRSEWGGLPYEDLVKGIEYIERELDFVDPKRMVALGASYGGYMMNWIQGHELGRKFQALVCHDGVFSMAAQLASDEQYFPNHDLGGAIWEKKGLDRFARWDPARHVDKWATPQLTIHNELDYRLTVAEGLAVFNALQGRGVESAFLSFPDENHWVLKHENSLVWHHAVINWINRFVQLPPLKERDGTSGVLEAVSKGRRRH